MAFGLDLGTHFSHATNHLQLAHVIDTICNYRPRAAKSGFYLAHADANFHAAAADANDAERVRLTQVDELWDSAISRRCLTWLAKVVHCRLASTCSQLVACSRNSLVALFALRRRVATAAKFISAQSVVCPRINCGHQPSVALMASLH